MASGGTRILAEFEYAMEFNLLMIPLEYFSTTIFLPLQILLIFQVPSFLSWHFTIKVHLSFIMYSHIVVIVYLLSHYGRRQWHPTPVLLPGKSHGRKSLVGCSPWGRSESGTTERLQIHISLSCIGGGHGNPLQCSCLENPRDCGAWWAAVHGVTQTRTRLKRLRSSSSSSSSSA